MRDGERKDAAAAGYTDAAQTHVHEFSGSVKISEHHAPHNHRFSGVTGEAVFTAGGHVHEIKVNTDYYSEHFHLIADKTGLDIPGDGGDHVHFARGETAESSSHRHRYAFATLIENPTDVKYRKEIP